MAREDGMDQQCHASPGSSEDTKDLNIDPTPLSVERSSRNTIAGKAMDFWLGDLPEVVIWRI